VKKRLLILGFLLFNGTLSLASEREGDILDQEDYDPSTPYYQVVPTNWSIGLKAAINKIPIDDSIGSVYELSFEKHLLFQKIGILSIGANVGSVPLDVSRYGNLKYGILARYQLHVFKNQIIVPTVAAIYEYFRIGNNQGVANTYSSPGILFGGMLNLGFFDRQTARDGYQSIGMNRAYLTLEFRPIDMTSFDFVTRPAGATKGDSGNLWYMGIRMEFE
jgi:hypothetical protein